MTGLTPADLPAPMPEPCPICGKVVYLTGVDEWGADPGHEGEIVGATFDCETEPDIDSDGWEEWHRGHYRMPYVYWLPWEDRAIEWLNSRFRWRPSS